MVRLLADSHFSMFFSVNPLTMGRAVSYSQILKRIQNQIAPKISNEMILNINFSNPRHSLRRSSHRPGHASWPQRGEVPTALAHLHAAIRSPALLLLVEDPRVEFSDSRWMFVRISRWRMGETACRRKGKAALWRRLWNDGQ